MAKSFKICAATIILVVAGIFSGLFVSGKEKEGIKIPSYELSQEPERQHGRLLQDEDERYIYKVFSYILKNDIEGFVSIPEDVTVEPSRLNVIARSVKEDFPEYAPDSYRYEYKGDSVVAVKMSSFAGRDKYLSMIEDIKEGLGPSPDFKEIYDAVLSVLSPKKDGPISYTAYAIFDGISVCDGYAMNLSYLATLYGYDNYIVKGSNHAWNIVKIDGKWYEFDPTWDDDPVREYKFYSCSTEKMAELHGFEREDMLEGLPIAR